MHEQSKYWQQQSSGTEPEDLCDKLLADICLYKKEGERVTECEHFIPILGSV